MPSADDCPNREKVMKDCYGKLENGKRQTRSDVPVFERLCQNVHFSPEGIQIGDSTTVNIDKNPRGTGGWSNMFMLNYEAGMYKKFDIDDVAMRGTGCEGINLQNPDEMWTDGWDGEGRRGVMGTHLLQGMAATMAFGWRQRRHWQRPREALSA